MRKIIISLLGVVLLGVGTAQAQVMGEVVSPGPDLPGAASGSEMLPETNPDWGLTNPRCYMIPGYVFNNVGDSEHGRTTGGYIFWSGGGSLFDQTMSLPSGASVYGVRTFFFDQDQAAAVELWLYWLNGQYDSGFTSTQLMDVYSTVSAGYEGNWHVFDPPWTIQNFDVSTQTYNNYLVTVFMHPSGALDYLRFGGVAVWYKLQVSPAPATATFNDVPTGHWAFRFIEALVSSGITAGCGGGNYCPDQPITRAEMAVYLSAALGLDWPD